MENNRKSERLTQYRAKRSVEATPEPFGEEGLERPRLFVVQKHAARRTHYDLRLEWGGTLLSWAVPQGPSPDPADKRLAVHVEDHPVEYADFEGMIPAGNYGAGAVIVWDRGRWEPVDDPHAMFQTGKLHFVLHGYKLHGEWILVRTKRGPKDWLLFKKKDAWARVGAPEWGEESILSGLTVEELAAGKSPGQEVRAGLEKLRAPRRAVDPASLGLMLAETAEKPFSAPGWLFELKYDGYRMVTARSQDGAPFLRYRNGQDVTAIFPELARAVRALAHGELILDAEVVVLDDQGRPSFARLQERGQIRRARDAEAAAVENPATLFVFDLLAFEGFDLRPLPLTARKELLRRVLPRTGPLRFSDHVEERGEELFEGVRKMGLEGLIAKRADAPYKAGRSDRWLKLRADRSGDFVVCGYTAPKGGRFGFGALHLGAYRDGELIYTGRAGSGFDERQLDELKAGLESLTVESCPCVGPAPQGKEHVWVKPTMVVEVRYKTWTADGLLRHPVFLRVREDKRPEECLLDQLPGASPARDAEERLAALVEEGAPEPVARRSSAAGKSSKTTAPREPNVPAESALKLTNLTKVFWPTERYTKKDLIDYYRAISPWLLPYLADRPVVLTRYPDGIDGKSFYQKDAPVFTPDWIRTVPIWSQDTEKDIRYIVCESVEALVFLANLGSIPLHVWSSRVETLQKPDWCILDLDPKGAPFEQVVELALALRDLAEEIRLPAFVKTSGSTGLHVLIPLGRQCTYEQSRLFGNLIARVIHARHPGISTIQRSISMRGGKVYLDFLQNRHGQLLVAPFSVRPLPGAPVSTPLEWREVNGKLDMRAFDIRTTLARVQKHGDDPMREVLEMKPDLVGALERLSGKVGPEEKSERPSSSRRARGSRR